MCVCVCTFHFRIGDHIFIYRIFYVNSIHWLIDWLDVTVSECTYVFFLFILCMFKCCLFFFELIQQPSNNNNNNNDYKMKWFIHMFTGRERENSGEKKWMMKKNLLNSRKLVLTFILFYFICLFVDEKKTKI